MRMRSLERRVQILLDEPRYRKISAEAKRRRVSVATVIRDAIDQLPADADRRRQAIESILSAASMSVPSDPRDLRRELDASRDRAG
jgi:hypothetical protein